MLKKITKSERTRNMVIERMSSVFNKHGYSGTSMNDVQSITGLSRGAIYGLFDNKESMAIEVFDYNMSKVFGLFTEQTRGLKSCHDLLLAYGKVYKLLGRESVFFGGSPLMNTACEADDTNILLKEKVAKAFKQQEQGVKRILKNGVELGEFNKSIDIGKIAHSIISMLEGALMISKVTNDESSLDNIFVSLEELITGLKN